jgi:membrane protein DedA with SNARE-associated domain
MVAVSMGSFPVGVVVEVKTHTCAQRLATNLGRVDEDPAPPPREAPSMPWEGHPERRDLILLFSLVASGLYLLAWIPLTPVLVADHPVLLELFKGSLSGMVTMGAKARIGEASLLVAVLAALPGLMIFDPLYWWAGARWGRGAIAFFVGDHPKAAARISRIERLIHRWGGVLVVVAYFTPIPGALIYAAAGWTRMRLWVFLLLDLLGSLLWIGFCVGLGYSIGQDAVDVARAISRYGLYLTIALIVLVFARQYRKASRRAR